MRLEINTARSRRTLIYVQVTMESNEVSNKRYFYITGDMIIVTNAIN